HPVEDAQALVVARFLDHLPFASADPVGDADRLRRGVEAFELPFVVNEDLSEPARVESAAGPRSPVPDRREVPAIAEVAAQLRLAALRLPAGTVPPASPDSAAPPDTWPVAV